MKPMLTWSPTHSRSQVLWASTHRLGLSWLGHTPGWLPGPCGRLAPKISPTMRSSGRSSLWADMGTTGPGGGGVWPPAPQAPASPAPCRHPPFQALVGAPALGLVLLASLWPPRSEPTADACFNTRVWRAGWVPGLSQLWRGLFPVWPLYGQRRAGSREGGQGSGGAEAQEQGDTGHEGYGGAEKGRPALAGEGRGGDTVTGAPPPSRPWARGIKAVWRTLPALVQDWEGGGREIKRRGCQNPPLQTLPWGPRSIC